MKTLSILVPAYNEEESLPRLLERLDPVLQTLRDRITVEVLLLDNGSTDRTREVALARCAHDPTCRYLRYSRNFGAEASLLAGLDHASGDAVVILFSDLQDPPERIPDMVDLWQAGAEVVYGVVRNRADESFLKTAGARLAYWLIYHLTDCHIPPNATDFRLMDRRVVEALRSLREPDRYSRGLVHWIGFRQVPFTYDRSPRQAGRSSCSPFFYLQFALNAILCFSSKPMQLSMVFGFFLTISSLALGVVYVALRLWPPAFLQPPPPGLTTLILLALFLVGMNALFLGIIGAYVGRIYNQGKGRPLYIVAEKVNL